MQMCAEMLSKEYSVTPDVTLVALFSILDKTAPFQSAFNPLATELMVHWEKGEPAKCNIKPHETIVGPCLQVILH